MTEPDRPPASPRRAMVLAAGGGTRMRPVTDRLPKPLVKVGGRPLIDHVLDRLAAAGVDLAVVNVHHFADQIEQHLATRRHPGIAISDEREQLLDTGGGVVKALGLLGDAPFFHMNSDTIWIEGVRPNLDRLAASFDPARMDGLLLLAATATSIGYDGRGDFALGSDGRLRRRAEREILPFVYAGAAMFQIGHQFVGRGLLDLWRRPRANEARDLDFDVQIGEANGQPTAHGPGGIAPLTDE